MNKVAFTEAEKLQNMVSITLVFTALTVTRGFCNMYGCLMYGFCNVWASYVWVL